MVLLRKHFYTIDENEGNAFVQRFGGQLDRILGYVFATKPVWQSSGVSASAGSGSGRGEPINPDWNELVPIYHFYYPDRNDHFYTRSSVDVFKLIGGYERQGDVAWWMYGTQVSGTVPVYGNRHDTIDDHYYTTNPVGGMLSEGGAPYTADGILGYLYENPVGGTVAIRQYSRDYNR